MEDAISGAGGGHRYVGGRDGVCEGEVQVPCLRVDVANAISRARAYEVLLQCVIEMSADGAVQRIYTIN